MVVRFGGRRVVASFPELIPLPAPGQRLSLSAVLYKKLK